MKERTMGCDEGGTMTCETARDLLSARIDGELAPMEAAEVAHHVAACRECGRRSDLLLQTRHVFRSAAPRRRFAQPVALVAIAGMLVLAVVAIRGTRPASRPPSPHTPAAGTASGAVVPPGGAMDTIDCGLPDAVVCVLGHPCADGHCSPREPRLGLR